MSNYGKVIWKSIGVVIAIVATGFLALFILLPRLNHQPITPVYTTDFISTIEVQSHALQQDDQAPISGQVTTDTGRPVPALVRLFNAQRSPRKLDIVAQTYTDIEGKFTLEVPPGEYEVLIYKGPEYEYFIQPLNLPSGTALELDIGLHQLLDMASLGWFSGDPHQHSAFYDGADEVPDLLVANAANGLHFSVQTDHNSVGQNIVARDFLNAVELYSNEALKYLSIGGDEVSTTIGHMIAWEPKSKTGEYIHIDHSSPKADEPMANKKRALARMSGDYDRYAKFTQINHPGGGTRAYEQFGEKRGDSFMDVDFDWVENRERILAFDATETWNGGSGFLRSMYHFGSTEKQPFEAYERTFHEWFRLLNTGAKFPSLGSSDTHDASATRDRARFTQMVEGIRQTFWGFLPYMPPQLVYKLTGSVEAGLMYNELDYLEYALEEIALLPGSPRTYIYTGGELSTDALIKNIAHSFISSGPLMFVEVAGVIPGETAHVTGNDEISIDAVSHKPLHKLMVIADGELVHEQTLDNVMRIKETIELDLSARKWVIVYLEGNNNYAHAFTNPIYLQ